MGKARIGRFEGIRGTNGHRDHQNASDRILERNRKVFYPPPVYPCGEATFFGRPRGREPGLTGALPLARDDAALASEVIPPSNSAGFTVCLCWQCGHSTAISSFIREDDNRTQGILSKSNARYFLEMKRKVFHRVKNKKPEAPQKVGRQILPTGKYCLGK